MDVSKKIKNKKTIQVTSRLTRWRDRLCWPLLCLSRPFMIFDGCTGIRNQSAAVASGLANN
jgi:hypothetical protein